MPFTKPSVLSITNCGASAITYTRFPYMWGALGLFVPTHRSVCLQDNSTLKIHHQLRHLTGKLPCFPLTRLLSSILTPQSPLYSNIHFGIQFPPSMEKDIVILIKITLSIQINSAEHFCGKIFHAHEFFFPVSFVSFSKFVVKIYFHVCSFLIPALKYLFMPVLFAVSVDGA